MGQGWKGMGIWSYNNDPFSLSFSREPSIKQKLPTLAFQLSSIRSISLRKPFPHYVVYRKYFKAERETNRDREHGAEHLQITITEPIQK